MARTIRIPLPLSLLGIAVAAFGFSCVARAENSRQTVEWQLFLDKDPLTDKVTQRTGGQVIFPDGNAAQVFARCAEVSSGGGPYPGVSIVVATFDGNSKDPKPFAWLKGAVEIPIVINEGQRPSVHAYTDEPRSNRVSIGFYDPAAARRLTHYEPPPMMKHVDAYRTIAAMKQQMAWDGFVQGSAGTLSDLLQATSIRAQLPLIDGSADVIEIDPQNPVLKDYTKKCSAQFRSPPR